MDVNNLTESVEIVELRYSPSGAWFSPQYCGKAVVTYGDDGTLSFEFLEPTEARFRNWLARAVFLLWLRMPKTLRRRVW
jgi:hypothetical protein